MSQKSNRPDASAKNPQGDFDKFTDFMRRLVAVPHSEIKAKLEEEKAARKHRTPKPVSSSRASRAKR
jgi:hypothetical protein